MKIILPLLLSLLIQSTSFAQEAATKQSLADVVEDLLPSVVTISITSKISTNQEFGSGFIVSKDGFVVTNNHVIDEASEITAGLSSGEKFKAKIVSIDKKTDIAVLKIDSDKELKFAKFGDSTKARIGDSVIVVGNPFGLGLSVSTGIVSAKGRNLNNGQIDEFIQTDAAINNGNSGGPMFNSRGEIIGISTSILSPSGGNVGIGFAIPSSIAAQIVRQLKDKGEVVRGWIGISVQDVSDEIAETMKIEKSKGAFVTEITAGGPADQAGIVPTDVIVKIDEVEILEMKMLPKIISKYSIGKTAKITLVRHGKEKVVSVKVAKMREEAPKKAETRVLEKRQSFKSSEQILGIGVLELSVGMKKLRKIDAAIKGVFVAEVALKSEAATKGVMAGDVILSVNQTPLSSIDELKNLIEEAAKSGKKIYLFLKRGGSNYGVALSAK
ncbi:MAG: Do family serine endopeptidase [Rickettsiales bacterium]|nr:Do family serine endopeptidase [Rickettsiales bacterium]